MGTPFISRASINHKYPFSLADVVFGPGGGLSIVASIRISSLSLKKVWIIQPRVINID